MEALWLVLGLVLGGGVAAVVTWVVLQARSRQTDAATQSSLTLATARAADAQQALAAATLAVDTLRRDLATEQQHRATLAAKLAAETDNLDRQTEATSVAVAEAGRLTQAIADLRQRHAGLTATLDAERLAIAKQREQFDETTKRLRESFAEMSKDALKANREDFLATATQQFKHLQTEAAGTLETKKAELGQLLTPMKQTLDQYREQLTAIEQSRSTAYVDLKQNLAAVAAVQDRLATETTQLVGALRRPSGRGRWGELTLRRLFELAGLADHVTFTEQVSTADGKYRPDCIVQLPENRQVIVDSKCVLDAFLEAVACTDEAQRRVLGQKHADQVRSRVRDLASKAYWESFGDATDYVILFLPGEAFLYAAVELDTSLIEDALNQRVIVASPTTLLGLLRVIEHGWKHKSVEENARVIKDLGGRLYERVAKVAEHLQRLGRAVSTVTDAYNATLGSLERNVLSTAREMAKLGVPTKNVTIAPAEDVTDDTRSLRATAWKGLPAPAEIDGDLVPSPGSPGEG